MTKEYLVDRLVLALAKKFVADDLPDIDNEEDLYNDLAIEIQRTIDDWFEDKDTGEQT